MTTYAVRFNTDDRDKIEPLLDFVKSLDFVSSVEEADEEPAPDEETSIPAADGQFLSTEQIRKLYPNEWVLLGDPIVKGIEILGGKVLVHDPDKRNMALRGKEFIPQYARATHFYTGTFPKRATIGLIRKISRQT